MKLFGVLNGNFLISWYWKAFAFIIIKGKVSLEKLVASHTSVLMHLSVSLGNTAIEVLHKP